MFKCEKCGSTVFIGTGTYRTMTTYEETWKGEEREVGKLVDTEMNTGECIDRNLQCLECGDGNMNWVD